MKNTICRSNSTYGYYFDNSLPSCKDFKDCFQSKTLAETNYYLNGVTHGPVHIMIGGAWSADEVFQEMDMEYLLRGPVKVLCFKVLWRMGYTRCPTTCTSREHSECKCSVPDEYIEKYSARGILEATNMTSFLQQYLTNMTDSQLLNVLR